MSMPSFSKISERKSKVRRTWFLPGKKYKNLEKLNSNKQTTWPPKKSLQLAQKKREFLSISVSLVNLSVYLKKYESNCWKISKQFMHHFCHYHIFEWKSQKSVKFATLGVSYTISIKVYLAHIHEINIKNRYQGLWIRLNTTLEKTLTKAGHVNNIDNGAIITAFEQAILVNDISWLLTF